ncbi:MAG: hypothetical protein GXX96_37030 [Planctomycetaceae bacterium]|nr:hypothetical protein [Planctomycetaceae bacterium]
MWRHGIRRAGAGVQRSAFGTPTAVQAFVVILTVFCTSVQAEAAGGNRERKKARQNANEAIASNPQTAEKAGFDEADLRYLPDDCRVAGRIDVKTLLERPLGRKLATSSVECATLTPLNVKLEQIDQIIVGAESFGSNNRSRYVVIVHSKQPVVTSESHPSWSIEKLGSRTIWVSNTGDPTALCVVEKDVFLAGHPDTVREVLQRDGPAELPAAIDRAQRQVDPTAHVVFSILPSQDLVQFDMSGIPAARELLDGIDAVNVELRCDRDAVMKVVALCRDEATALQLKGIGLALLAVVQAQDMAPEQLALRMMADSVDLSVDKSVLTVGVAIPGELIQVTESSGNDKSLASGSSVTLAPVSNNGSPAQLFQSGAKAPVYSAGNSYSPGAAPAPVPPPGQHLPPIVQPYSPPVSTPYDPYAAPPFSFFCSTFPIPPAPPAPTLPLADVIRLSKAGVDEQVIIQYVGRHQLETALTADDLIVLTENKVTVGIISVLQGLPCANTSGGNAVKTYKP